VRAARVFRLPAHPSRRAAAAVELALVLPLLLTIILGVWDMGRLVDVSQILINAAREGGRCASTGQVDPSGIQQAVVQYLNQAGIPTAGATVTLDNLTNSDNGDPRIADQLDQFRIAVTLPSNNVRWIATGGLIGSSTLRAECLWNSMRDLPLTVSTTIPIE
jgi:Flp pilus assembly protein TadG